MAGDVGEAAGAYESLLSFLYKAPVAALQTSLDGDIEMMTPLAAQVLVPLAPTGQPVNLIEVLQPYAPQLRTLLDQATGSNAVVCDGLPIQVRDAASGLPPKVLSLSLLKLQGREVMAVIADTTREAAQQAAQRRESAHKLSEMSASLNQALATMSIALAREDLTTGRLFPNDRLREWLGMPAHESVPSAAAWLAHVHPDDRARYVEDHQRAVAGGQAGFREFRILRPDETVAYLAGRRFLERDDQGRPTWLTTFAVDVTDQRLADQERLALAERLLLATEAAAIGTFEIAGPRRMMFWNRLTCSLFGHEQMAWADPRRVLEQALSEEDLARFDQWVAGVFTAQGGRGIEFVATRPDGQRRWLAAKGRLQVDSTGAAVALMGVVWDVTEQRQAAEAEQARRVAEHANRAKNDFLSRMSHELRTPLNAIIGFSDLLLSGKDPGLTPKQARQVTRVRDSGRHLLALIVDLMDVSRIESGTLRLQIAEIDLLQVLQQALDTISTQAQQRGMHVVSPPPTPGVRVRVDPVRLRQVLTNLLTNAIKYNREGGHVEVRLSQVEHYWRLSVIDTGVGLSEAQQNRLFRPFDRLGQENSNTEGTGIGLVITQQLVLAMQGRLSVTSTPGVGSQFDVDLPACLDAAPIEAHAAPEVEITRRADVVGRVLAAEDNPESAEVLRGFLEWRPGVKLEIAPTGQACISAARDFGPDLVLLDMRLPDMQGTELLARLREALAPRELPCIFISANAMPDERVEMQGARYMTKPVSLEPFLQALDLALGAPAGV